MKAQNFLFGRVLRHPVSSGVALLLASASGLVYGQVPVDLPAGQQVVQVSTPAPPQPPGAGEWGRVISSTPVLQQVNVPQRVCTPVVSTSESSGGSPAGAAVGAIAGGAIGNAIGRGNGRAAATAVGVFGGAILGSMIGGNDSPKATTSQQCTTQSTVENRTVAFNVVYEYAGKQFQAQLPKDPGGWVQLQVAPIIQGTAPPSVPAVPLTSAPILTAPVTTVVPVTAAAVVVAPSPVVYATPVVYETAYVQPVVRQVVRPIVTVSTPIVIGSHRHVVHPRVVYQPAPVVVHSYPAHPRPVHSHRMHHVQPVTPVSANVVRPIVAPAVVHEHHPVPRTHRPGVVVPEAAPRFLHIKETQAERQYL